MIIGYVNLILSSLYSKNYEINKPLIYCDSIIHISNCTNPCKFSLNYLHESCNTCFDGDIERYETQIYMNVLKELLPIAYNNSLNECSNIQEKYDDIMPLVMGCFILLFCFIYFLCKDC